MAKGYWIVRGDIADPEKYKGYLAANGAAFSKFGARFLVRGGTFAVAEGESRSRHVVLEFPSYADALACYDSPEYAAAMAHRIHAATLDIVIVEGYDGPQPGA